MAINSRQKGKRGEREAAAFLRSIGFETARRTMQYNGEGVSDVMIETLPDLHIEVKFGYPITRFDLCTSLHEAACIQAEGDADGKVWVVLWKPLRYKVWRLSFKGFRGHIVTVSGKDAIFDVIKSISLPHVQATV